MCNQIGARLNYQYTIMYDTAVQFINVEKSIPYWITARGILRQINRLKAVCL
jgi:hypothetical protein